jgi:hypothetical protein
MGVSVLGATTPTSAGAAPHDVAAAGQAKRRLVSVKVAGDPTSVAAVLDVLRERDGGGDVETTFEVVPAIDRASIVTPGAPNDRQLARIWIDLTEPSAHVNEPEPVTLYVVDGPWERVLVRPVVRHANPEITWEEIGHIVELALGALRAGETIGVGRDIAQAQLFPSPPPNPRPSDGEPPRRGAPPPAVERAWKIRGGGFYSTTAYGSGLELASGLGALLEGHARTRKLEYGVTLTAEYHFPSTVDRGAAMIRFDGGALHALASGAYFLGDRHQLLLGVGGGLELVHARGSSSELDNVRFIDRGLDLIPTARALARYGYSTSSLRLFAGVGVDVPLTNSRYLLSKGAPVVLFEPWSVRPFLMIGLETN